MVAGLQTDAGDWGVPDWAPEPADAAAKLNDCGDPGGSAKTPRAVASSPVPNAAPRREAKIAVKHRDDFILHFTIRLVNSLYYRCLCER